jgi:hypothetical protein
MLSYPAELAQNHPLRNSPRVYGSFTNAELTIETSAHVITRAERAHWRLTWKERLAHNARSEDAPSLTLHGLPATFAHVYGLVFLGAE